VNLSETGWQPGETVSLTLVESPFYDTHGPFTAIANSNENIFNNQFATDVDDLNIRLYLSAKSKVSQAQMTFTDVRECDIYGLLSLCRDKNRTIGGTPVTYNYPKSVVCSGSTYNVVFASPASPFTSGSNTNVSAP